MDRSLVRRLLLYIVDQLQDQEAEISTIRLVKFLYLIDLEHFQRHRRTLSGIAWIFHHYGPYFFELEGILRSASIDLDAREVMTPRGKGYTYRSLEDQEISGLVDFATEQLVNRVIKRWSLESTRTLLAFTYDTAPIAHGKRGKPLDFTTALGAGRKERPARPVARVTHQLMLASEAVLARDWDTPEEDEAWGYLSSGAK